MLRNSYTIRAFSVSAPPFVDVLIVHASVVKGIETRHSGLIRPVQARGITTALDDDLAGTKHA